MSSNNGQSNLPLFALLGGIFFPLVGIIIGHIALGQMNRGEISPHNRGMALAGTIIGYAFIGLSILVSFVLFAVLAGAGLSGGLDGY